MDKKMAKKNSSLQKQTLKVIFNNLANLSDENLIQIIEMGEEYLIDDPTLKQQAEDIKKLFEQKHPALELVRRTLTSISKECRDKLIENLIINAMVVENQRRQKLAKELGFGLPWFFVMSPTAQCNLNCRGCYAGRYIKDEGLPFELVDRILNEAKELGIYFVVISGGEPYFWPHILEVFEKHNDMYFMTYTNGTLLTKEMTKKLAKLGNVAPAISIEGFEKETDDRRGPGTFKKIMEAMDNLKEAGVPFGFSVTPTKLNVEALMSDEFVDLMIQKGCSFGWYFQYVPVGRKPDVNLMVSPEDRNRLRMRTNEIRNTKPLFVGDFWNDGPYAGGCIAGARPGGYFHINCNGGVEPCAFLQFSVDNIKDKHLLDVIRSPFFQAFQEAQPYCENGNLLTPCALIDNPEVLRRIVKEYNAKPSYEGADDAICNPTICHFLDEYSKAYKKIADPVWESGMNKKYKHWKEKAAESAKKNNKKD